MFWSDGSFPVSLELARLVELAVWLEKEESDLPLLGSLEPPKL